MSLITEKIQYTPKLAYNWNIQPQTISIYDLEALCETCDSIKDRKIEKLKNEIKKLLRLMEFLRGEIKSFELKTAVSEKAVSLKELVREFTSTPEGQVAWQEAWKERAKEWKRLVRIGKMSRIKYYRLINGIDQITLAKKLGTAQPNISRIEKPGYNVPTKTLKQLTKIFAVKMEDLIGD